MFRQVIQVVLVCQVFNYESGWFATAGCLWSQVVLVDQGRHTSPGGSPLQGAHGRPGGPCGPRSPYLLDILVFQVAGAQRYLTHASQGYPGGPGAPGVPLYAAPGGYPGVPDRNI